MYADLDYSAFANLNLRHFETESAERPPLFDHHKLQIQIDGRIQNNEFM